MSDPLEAAASHITPGHVRAFQAVTSRMYDNITLWSCTINGEPGVAIVMVDEAAPGQIAVMPLFVAITPTMKIDFAGTLPSRRRRRSGGDDGGPTDPREAFHEAKQDATYPQPT